MDDSYIAPLRLHSRHLHKSILIQAWLLLGISYEKQSRFNDADTAFRKTLAIALADRGQTALANIGLMDIAMQQRNWQDALNFGSAALKAHYYCDEAAFNMAEVYINQGQEKMAVTYARRAAKKSPEFPELSVVRNPAAFKVVMVLADLLMKSGDYAGAQKELYDNFGKPKLDRNGKPRFKPRKLYLEDPCDALCSLSYRDLTKEQRQEADAKLQEIWQLQQKTMMQSTKR